MNALTPKMASDELVGAGLPVELAERVAAGLSTLTKLERVIIAAERARGAAAIGKLWDKPCGAALVNAMYELTKCDALYDLAKDLGWPLGVNADGSAIEFGGRA